MIINQTASSSGGTLETVEVINNTGESIIYTGLNQGIPQAYHGPSPIPNVLKGSILTVTNMPNPVELTGQLTEHGFDIYGNVFILVNGPGTISVSETN